MWTCQIIVDSYVDEGLEHDDEGNDQKGGNTTAVSSCSLLLAQKPEGIDSYFKLEVLAISVRTKQ